ncbi:MAG: fibronectin type III domain-containing protein [Microbacteriaceae bacterium]
MVTIGPINKSSPSVQFGADAWVHSQDIASNTSVIRVQQRSINTGSSSSQFLNAGSQVSSIDGVGEVVRHDGHPFLPSVASGATRWVETADVTVTHNANGDLGPLTVRMQLVYGSVNESHTALLYVTSLARTPTGLSATRVSDAQVALTWTRVGSYASVIVQRSTDDGPWQQVGVAGVDATAFTDTTTGPNRKYVYRVAGTTGAGQSGWSATGTVFTTPAAPTGVSAERSGSDIRVSAAGVPPYATSFDVRDGGTVVASGVSLPWTHAAPNPAVPHAYEVRGKVGALVGAWSVVSNTVQLISPPNAPIGLAPNGAVRASDELVRFSWVHNPVDSSAQTVYELRHRVGAAAWTVLTGTTDQFRDVSLGVASHDWQVRTKGTHPDWSPWSATAGVEVIDRPGVAVVQPDTDWDASILPVEWSWLQGQGRPQSAWQVELSQAGAVVETREGSGPAVTATFTTRLSEGAWTVRVRAATGDVWSVWASEMFTVTFDPPAAPVLTGAWDEGQGGVNLTVGPGDTPGAAATVTIVLERSVGAGWELVGEFTALTSIIDWESLSFGPTEYRATAFTLEGATTVTLVTVDATSGAFWLSGGVGFGITGRLPFDPKVTVSAARERALKRYAGRSKPVALTGEALSRVFAVSGRITDLDPETANVEQLTRIAHLEQDVFLFRDPDGRRVYGAIGEVQLPRESSMSHPDGWNGLWGYSFTLTEATT